MMPTLSRCGTSKHSDRNFGNAGARRETDWHFHDATTRSHHQGRWVAPLSITLDRLVVSLTVTSVVEQRVDSPPLRKTQLLCFLLDSFREEK